MKKLAIIAALAASTLSGCAKYTTPNEKVIEPISTNVQTLCIEHNAKVTFPVEQWIKETATNAGYVLKAHSCDATIEYTARRYFDFHAPLALTDIKAIDAEGNQVGSIYFTQGSGLQSAEYWQSSKQTMYPMLEEMFSK